MALVTTGGGISHRDDYRYCMGSNVAFIFDSHAGGQRNAAVNNLTNLVGRYRNHRIRRSRGVASDRRQFLDRRKHLNRFL